MTRRLEVEAPPADHAFLRKAWGDCWHNLPGLLGANLLFLLWCAPAALAAMLQLDALALALAVVSVGPALLGLVGYVANLVLERPASFWRDSLRGVRARYGAGASLGGIAILALTAHRLALANAVHAGMPAGAVALWAGQVGVLAVLALVGPHTVGLIGLYGQGLREAFRNALVLALGYPAPSLGLVGAAVLSLLAARALRWGPLVILPALLAVLALNTTFLLVKRHQPNSRA